MPELLPAHCTYYSTSTSMESSSSTLTVNNSAPPSPSSHTSISPAEGPSFGIGPCEDPIIIDSSSEIELSDTPITNYSSSEIELISLDPDPKSKPQKKRSKPVKVKSSQSNSKQKGKSRSSKHRTKKSRVLNPASPSPNWPDPVQFSCINPALSMLVSSPSPPPHKHPSFTSELPESLPPFQQLLPSTLLKIPSLTSHTPPSPSSSSYVPSSPSNHILLRLVNRKTGCSVQSDSLSVPESNASNVLEICTGDILSFFDSQNRLAIPQRVILADRILEGENGFYHLPTLNFSAIDIWLHVIYGGLGYYFRCIDIHRLSQRYKLI